MLFAGAGVQEILALSLVFVIAITVHEFAHAWTADQLGDDTPRLQGRLTLNPLKHLDPIGTLLLLVAGFGWGRPVQINPAALQATSRAGMMLVAAAGPLSNLVMAILASVPFRLGLVSPSFDTGGMLPSLDMVFTLFIWINLVLMLFNLIPVFPLDGEKILTYFLPPAGKSLMAQIRPYTPFILLLLFAGGRFGAGAILDALVSTPASWMFGILVS